MKNLGNITNPQDIATKGYVDGVAVALVEITWADLKALRDTNNLVAGRNYRITDYNCTTAQEYTTSANHQFDIIVVADDESTLNENARAIKHDGDTYFASCNLASWELKYCIDNDTNRFVWADSTNGKGVIFFMKDEFNNECPYDFKNIQFYRKWNADKNAMCDIVDGSAEGAVACYTFSSAASSSTTSVTDSSLSKGNSVYSNSIKERIYISYTTWEDTLYLNNNCFFGTACYFNTFGDNCYSNTLGTACYSNTLGNKCYSNTFGGDCYSNTFGDNCYSNTLGGACYSNTLGNKCYSNTLGTACYFNTFGGACYSNTFGGACYSNTLGTACYFNTFGHDCYSNTFGDNCYSNTLGDSCKYITFNSKCYSNTLGSNCLQITFGSLCYNVTAGDYFRYSTLGCACVYNTFVNSYMRYITLENGVNYCNINCSVATSSKSYAQYIHIKGGVRGTTSEYKNITLTSAGNTFLTTISNESNVVINV